ncbi:telomere length regulation protein TEL2 homolog isoform X2 [Tubulanus polymorphus]
MADIRAYVKTVLNSLSQSSDPENGLHSLQGIVSLLTERRLYRTVHLPFSESEISEVSTDFIRNHYPRFLERFLQMISVDWISRFPKDRMNKLMEQVVLNGPPADSFICLTTCIQSCSLGYQCSLLVSLLEKYLLAKKLNEFLLSECAVKSFHHKTMWDQLVAGLISFPDKMANKLKTENSDEFLPRKYIRYISDGILSAMEQAHSCLSKDSVCSLEFVSILCGRICFCGFSDILWDELLPVLIKHAENDFIWRRVCERVITGVPDNCIESVIIPIIKRADWYGSVHQLLGDAVINNHKVEFLLCKKMLLQRYFKEGKILQNIIGYLSLSNEGRKLIPKVLLSLLRVWGDGSAIKHTSYEQHSYITKAILVCVSFMDEQQLKQYKDDVMSKVLEGVQPHLESSVPQIRLLGMFIGKHLIVSVDPQGHKLEFEVEKTAEIDELVKLLVKPTRPDCVQLRRDLHDMTIEDKDLHKVGKQETSDENKKQGFTCSENEESDLDSDDDLQPYDMSHDVPVSKVKKPYYIRDCMEGFLSTDDPDRVELCLSSAEDLIRNANTNIDEIAEEFAKILLHLNDNFNTTEFSSLRRNALVALTVTCPVKAANYLTHEFYERNYNIKQRLDILEVLAASAKELSKPSTLNDTAGTCNAPLIKVITKSSRDEEESWRDVVQKRIESKTRRFGKGRVKPDVELVKNKFASVAGNFFFPLMLHFDRQENTLRLLGEDSLVLSRLLYTLGVIMYAALHCPVAMKMASTLLHFIWVIRFHSDCFVRRGALFATSMVILSLPGFLFMSELQAEITEVKAWMEYVIEKDPDTESKKLAIQALCLLESALKEEFTKASQMMTEAR